MAEFDLLLEAERRGILPEDKKLLLIEARRRGLVPGDEPTTVAPVTSNPPRFPKTERFIEEATIPLLTAGAGMLPGALPIQMAIGGAGEAINELAQGESLDPTKIGVAAAVPAGARGLVNAGRAIARTVANQAARPQMVEAAVGKVEDAMGVGKKATAALEAAKGITTPVTSYPETTKTIYSILGKEARLPGGSKAAMEWAEDTLEKINRMKPTTETVTSPIVTATGEKITRQVIKPGAAPLIYGEIMESTSALREAAEAAGDNRTKKLVYDVRESLLNDITKLDPAAREAFGLYRRQEAVKEVAKKFRSAGDRLSKLKNMLAEDALVAGAFTVKEKKVLESIASHIGPDGFLKIAGSLGMLGAAGYGAGQEPGAAMSAAVPALVGALVSHPAGQYLARGLIGPNGIVNKSLVPALAQFMRGYQARRATTQPQQTKRTPTLKDLLEEGTQP